MARNTPLILVRVQPEGRNAAVRLDESIRVTSLKYTETDHGADKCVLAVDNFDLRNFDDPVFRRGAILEVRWGYPESLSQARQCVIRKVTGSVVLNVEAHGLAVLMDTVTRARTFENMTRSEVARSVLTENGWQADQIHIEDSGIRFPTIHQARQSDAAFLQRLAHQEGFQFFTGSDGVHFHRRAVGSSPTRTFTYYIDRTGEIMEWNVENDVTAAPGRVRAVGRDLMGRTDIDVTADADSESDAAVLGEVREIIDPETGGATFSERTASETTVTTSQPTAEAAQRAASAQFRRVQQTAVRLTMTCVGDALVTKAMVIQINGISRRLSGRYYIHENEHSVESGVYTMAIKARTDGTNGHGPSTTDGIPTPPEAAATGARAPDGTGAGLEAREVVDPEGGGARTQWFPTTGGGPGSEGPQDAR